MKTPTYNCILKRDFKDCLWTECLESEPALGVHSSFRLLCWGVDWCGAVGGGIWASATWMKHAEGEGSLATKAIWQQTVLVQVDLRVRAAHLAVQRCKQKDPLKPNVSILTAEILENLHRNRKKNQLFSPRLPQIYTVAAHLECQPPTQIQMTFETKRRVLCLVLAVFFFYQTKKKQNIKC